MDGFGPLTADTDGVAIATLEPGTTLLVHTRNSEYRFVILSDEAAALVSGGALFPEATIVRFGGATAGGSALKVGWILVGLHIEMWTDCRHVRTSPVSSIAIEKARTPRAEGSSSQCS